MPLSSETGIYNAWEKGSTIVSACSQRGIIARGTSEPLKKVAMRCRFEDPGFRPLAGDRAALLAAAERSGNSELAEVLKMG